VRHTQAGTPPGAHAHAIAGAGPRWEARPTSQRADSPGTAPIGARLPRFVTAHLSSEQVSEVVYGTVIVAVGLAELYSELIGARVRGEVGERHRGAIASNVVAVVAGAAFPAVFFVLAAVDLIELSTAFSVAKWSGLGLIALYGFWAARLGGARHGRAFMYAAGVAAAGALVIGVKALVH
jgi:hypothetical protein